MNAAGAFNDMEACFYSTITKPEVIEGAHRLILSIILAVSTTPKTALTSFPLLASLGKVTDQLQTICSWDASVMVKIKETHRMRNNKIKDSGLFHHFFAKFAEEGPGQTSTPDRPSRYLGRYYKLMLSEIAEAPLHQNYWTNDVTLEQLDLAKILFNKKDSDVAIITSELLDLPGTALALTSTSNFNSEGMSEPDTHFSALDSIHDLNSFLDKSISAQNEILEANISEERVRWSSQVRKHYIYYGNRFPKFFHYFFKENTPSNSYANIHMKF